jgi:hypothetical protein
MLLFVDPGKSDTHRSRLEQTTLTDSIVLIIIF